MRSALPVLVAIMLAAPGCSVRTGEPPIVVRPSLTIFPVEMAGDANRQVAEVAAVLLEQRGLAEIAIAEAPFAAPPGASFDEAAAAFAEFFADSSPTTDYALHAAVLGAPDRGVDETRVVLARRDGVVAWTDRQERSGEALRRAHPTCPLEAVVFLVERIHDPLALLEPSEARAEGGTWTTRMRVESHVPDDSEFAAMEARLVALRRSQSLPSVAVHPAHVGRAWSAEGAVRLVDAINARGLMRAVPAEEPIEFAVEESSNEQRVLWSAARSMQRAVREHPPTTDYVLFVDHLIRREGEPARGVHTFLLDRDGEWVLVDLQNSHHADYRRIAPRSAAACTELSLRRLERALGD